MSRLALVLALLAVPAVAFAASDSTPPVQHASTRLNYFTPPRPVSASIQPRAPLVTTAPAPAFTPAPVPNIDLAPPVQAQREAPQWTGSLLGPGSPTAANDGFTSGSQYTDDVARHRGVGSSLTPTISLKVPLRYQQ